MKIGIDARPFRNKEYSGIPKSIYEVLLKWIENNKKENEYYLISNSEIYLPCEIPSNWKKVVVPAYTGNGTLWQIFRLRRIIKELKLDWFWGTNFMLPQRVKGCRYLLTVHDLAFEIMPEVVSNKNLIILKLFCKKSCKRADYIHSVSESTKNDLTRLYGINPDIIKVIYWGVEESNRTVDCEKATAPDYRFILVLGTIEPRKNILTIVRAFDKFKECDDKDVHLVFAGRYGWKYDTFNTMIKESEYSEYIHVLEFVDNDKKEILLRKADMLMYPSLYEGFGLPILEAYQRGLIVVTARNSSIPEVAGDAAFYTDDCYDYERISALIKEVILLDDEKKEELKVRMKNQLSKFSWKECADSILGLLE